MAWDSHNYDYETGTRRPHGRALLCSCVTEEGAGDVQRLMPYLALYTLLTRLTGHDSPLSISLYWVLLSSVSKF